MVAEGLTAAVLAGFLLLAGVCIVVSVGMLAREVYMGARQLRRRLSGRRRRERVIEASNEPREIPLEPAFQWPEKQRMDAHAKHSAWKADAERRAA